MHTKERPFKNQVPFVGEQAVEYHFIFKILYEQECLFLHSVPAQAHLQPAVVRHSRGGVEGGRMEDERQTKTSLTPNDSIRKSWKEKTNITPTGQPL